MSDERREEQAERGEAEQADPDAAPLLVGLAGHDHGGRRSVPGCAELSDDDQAPISLETAESKPSSSSSSSSSANAEGAMAVDAFWSTASSSIAKTSEPVSLSSRSKSLAASSWTVLSSESPSERLTSTSKSVSSKMSFSPFLTAGGGVAASDGLALDGLALECLARFGSVSSRFVGERGELDRVGLAQAEAGPGLKIDSRIAGPREVDAGDLGI